jgi:carboxyl-terminal processing protease
MSKYLFTLLCFLTFSSYTQVKLTETTKLAATTKVWGFLKYYHPQVAKGNYNWDNQLFVILDQLEAVNTTSELSNLFVNWIDTLGKVSCFKRNHTKNAFETNFNLAWLKDSTLFTPELSERLKAIELHRHKGKNYYVNQTAVGNIITSNEVNYPNFKWTNKHLRLLSLFRYWNTIEYFFPYKYQTDVKWDDVLLKMVPQFNNPTSEMEYHLAMLELTVSINDSHSSFTTPLTREYFGLKYISTGFKLIENKAIFISIRNDSLAKVDDLKLGDLVTKVNGESIQSILDRQFKYLQGSNTPSKLRRSFRAIFNGDTDSVDITFERNGKTSTKTIHRYDYSEFNMKPLPINNKIWSVLDHNIGYVHMGNLEREDLDSMMTQLMSTQAIIFDLRHYPNSTISPLLSHLNKTPTIVENAIIADLNYPGKFFYKKAYPNGNKNNSPYQGKVIVLVNEHTQSQGEHATMGLQTVKNSIIIGSQTAGADGEYTPFTFIGGYEAKYTGIGIFYPDGTETQRIGIVSDILVNSTIKGIKNGKDEVLDKALEFIITEQL